MFDRLHLFLRRIIEIGYSLLCFILYFSGVYYVISILRRRSPVILYYHSVNRQDYPFVYPDNIVSVENFGKQMAYLSHKKRIISLSELSKYIENGMDFPPNLAIITFDDGYYDFYSKAYPILKKYNAPCTLFPITGLLEGGVKWEDVLTYVINTTSMARFSIRIRGDVKTYDLTSPHRRINCIRELNSLLVKMDENERNEAITEIERLHQPPYKPFKPVMLSWKEVLELNRDELVTFGSHTNTHYNLASISAQKAWLEISESKEKIERFLDKPCTIFSYPFGKRDSFNEDIKEMLRMGGFSLAVTTMRGTVSKKTDPFELRRIAAVSSASYKFKCSLIGIALQRS